MAKKNKGQKLGIACGPPEVSALQERVKGLAKKLEELRIGLVTGNLKAVKIKPGTFEHHLGAMELLVIRFKCEYDYQSAVADQKAKKSK
jgi:hypothetical protein